MIYCLISSLSHIYHNNCKLMKTKTSQLLFSKMKSKGEASDSDPVDRQQKVITRADSTSANQQQQDKKREEKQRSQNKKGNQSHISHTIEYTHIAMTSKPPQQHKLVQVQNLRLLSSLHRLQMHCHNLEIMAAIAMIEQFRYFEGTTKLYDLLSQLERRKWKDQEKPISQSLPVSDIHLRQADSNHAQTLKMINAFNIQVDPVYPRQYTSLKVVEPEPMSIGYHPESQPSKLEEMQSQTLNDLNLWRMQSQVEQDESWRMMVVQAAAVQTLINDIGYRSRNGFKM